MTAVSRRFQPADHPVRWLGTMVPSYGAFAIFMMARDNPKLRGFSDLEAPEWALESIVADRVMGNSEDHCPELPLSLPLLEDIEISIMDRETLLQALEQGPVRVTMNDVSSYDIDSLRDVAVDSATCYLIKRGVDGRKSSSWR